MVGLRYTLACVANTYEFVAFVKRMLCEISVLFINLNLLGNKFQPGSIYYRSGARQIIINNL